MPYLNNTAPENCKSEGEFETNNIYDYSRQINSGNKIMLDPLSPQLTRNIDSIIDENTGSYGLILSHTGEYLETNSEGHIQYPGSPDKNLQTPAYW